MSPLIIRITLLIINLKTINVRIQNLYPDYIYELKRMKQIGFYCTYTKKYCIFISFFLSLFHLSSFFLLLSGKRKNYKKRRGPNAQTVGLSSHIHPRPETKKCVLSVIINPPIFSKFTWGRYY